MRNKKQSRKPPVHPGKILREGYMREREITVGEMQMALGISRNQMSCIVNGRKGITTETAIRLAEVTGASASFWLSLQNKYDIWNTQQRISPKTRKHLMRFHAVFNRKMVS